METYWAPVRCQSLTKTPVFTTALQRLHVPPEDKENEAVSMKDAQGHGTSGSEDTGRRRPSAPHAPLCTAPAL